MTTITAVKWYPPKQPGWSGSFKAEDGNYYGCKEEMVASIPIGTPVEVEITTKEKDGKTYRDIKRVVSAGVAPAAKPQVNGTRYGSTDDATAERIYVCGILNAWVAHVAPSRDIKPSDLVTVTEAAREAWRQTFGKKADAA